MENLINDWQVPVNIEMVYVEGGTFTMGATPEQGDDVHDWEKPAHQVTVSSFGIGKYPVTQEQWEAVMVKNPSFFPGDSNPVERVNWKDAQKFIAMLNARTGMHYRLPTEAEWEFAARGGVHSKSYRFSGSDNIDDVAWYWGGGTHPVGTKAPNELGIYDMSGNVNEWCSDWFDKDYYAVSPRTNPEGPSKGSRHVMRGGSGLNKDVTCRVAYRTFNGIFSDSSDNNIGFRLVHPLKGMTDEDIARSLASSATPQQPQSTRIDYTDGSYYIGECMNGNPNGKGKNTYANGDVYEGDFVDGKRHGKGKYTWAAGGMYEGDFVDGNGYGKGKYTYVTGGVDEGDFVNFQFHGKGKRTYPDGRVEEGTFESGICISFCEIRD